MAVINKVVDLLFGSVDLFPQSLLLSLFILQSRQFFDLFREFFTFLDKIGKKLLEMLHHTGGSIILAKGTLNIGQFSSEWIRVN